MSRQRLTWIVIGVAFLAVLVVRGMTGQGLGRVYVKHERVSLAPVEEKAAGGKVKQAWVQVDEAKAVHRWDEWNGVPPKAFFEAQEIGRAHV